MAIYVQRTYTVTQESLDQLKEIQKEIGDSNMSAALRYAIKETYCRLKEQAS